MRTMVAFVLWWVCAASLRIPKRRYSKGGAHDLQPISLKQASFISRHWLHEITSYNPMIAKEDEPIVGQINSLETHAQERANERHFYVAWMPKGTTKQALFLVVSHVDLSARLMTVLQVVQSPLWSPEQIESTALKASLEEMAQTVDIEVDFEPLYRCDPRYKLEWKYQWKTS